MRTCMEVHMHLLCVLYLISCFHKGIVDGVKLHTQVQTQMPISWKHDQQ